VLPNATISAHVSGSPSWSSAAFGTSAWNASSVTWVFCM
jgi:hypothetical protein